MSKKELEEKINRRKVIEKINWFKFQIKECVDYIEVGTLNWLREMCFHAVKFLINKAKILAQKNNLKLDKIFNFH